MSSAVMVKTDQMIDEDHPLVLEISSLKAACNRFQDEAHTASLKLQRFSFDTSTAQDRVAALERDNELLRTELHALRANPHPDSSPKSHPAVLQSQELTLSLRRLSEKLSLTEQALLARTTDVVTLTSESTKARLSVESAYALAARTRGREEEGKVRERELERKIRELKEEIKMEDLVVKEYADLVRSLEGRTSTTLENTSDHTRNNSVTPLDGISEGKAGLQRLFAEFASESEKLEAEVERLRGELAASGSRLEAERRSSEADRVLLASAQQELQMLKIEDKSAAGMVSRYMKFSQASTNALQTSLGTLKTRHAATINTLFNQLNNLSTKLTFSEVTSDKLRTTLDELGKDIMRESYGRRREIALRLKLVVREEALHEAVGRWIRRGQELLRQDPNNSRQSLEKMVTEAQAVYAVLDTPSSAQAPSPSVSDAKYSPYSAPAGSLARIIATEASVKSLVDELQFSTARRQELELVVASTEPLLPAPVKDTVHRVNAHTMEQQDEVLKQNSVARHSPEPPDEQDPPQPDEEPVPVLESPPVLLQSIDSREVDLATDKPVPRQPVRDETSAESKSYADLEPVVTEVEATTSNPAPIAFPSFDKDEGNITIHSEETNTPLIEDSPRHPLLDELTQVSHRYDELQRAFRDCHLALQDLRKTIASPDAEVPQSSNPLPSSLPLLHTINGVSSSIFQTAIERLDDYNEDARVELEIRAADEALLAQGYQTMLMVSAPSSSPAIASAISSSSPTSLSRSFSHDSQPELTSFELEDQIRDFISGTDLNVQRAQQSLSRKLADVQNDIAVLKRALHDPDAFGPRSPSSSPITPTMNGLNSSTSASSSGWTSWIRSTPSRPASPAPAPTFGNVMTSPRLKHSSSFHRDLGRQDQQQPHPFANLDLRVSMPAFSSLSSRHAVFSPPGIDWHGPRTRTVSTMNMLGLGSARGANAQSNGGSALSPNASPRQQRRPSSSSTAEQNREDRHDEVGSDLEEDDVE